MEASGGTTDIQLNSAKKTGDGGDTKTAVIENSNAPAISEETIGNKLNATDKESVSEDKVKGDTLLSINTSYTVNTVNESDIYVSTKNESLTTNQADPRPEPVGAINTRNVSWAADSSKDTIGFNKPVVQSNPVAESSSVASSSPVEESNPVVESAVEKPEKQGTSEKLRQALTIPDNLNSSIYTPISKTEPDSTNEVKHKNGNTSFIDVLVYFENDFVDRHVGDDFDDSDEYTIDKYPNEDRIGEACRDDCEIINDILDSLRTDQAEYFTEYGNMVENHEHPDDHIDCDCPHTYDTSTHYELSVDSDSENDLDDLFNSDHDIEHDLCNCKDDDEDNFDHDEFDLF